MWRLLLVQLFATWYASITMSHIATTCHLVWEHHDVPHCYHLPPGMGASQCYCLPPGIGGSWWSTLLLFATRNRGTMMSHIATACHLVCEHHDVPYCYHLPIGMGHHNVPLCYCLAHIMSTSQCPTGNVDTLSLTQGMDTLLWHREWTHCSDTMNGHTALTKWMDTLSLTQA